jgi:peptide/nickel transport system permease protein
VGSYIIRKLAYGMLVLWGVITLVFAIFSINPGDPARMLLGQRVDEESLAKVRKELGLDLPFWKQYAMYLNDVSPVSLHKKTPAASYIYLNEEKYSYQTLLPLGNTVLVAKWPYLRRSYQSRKQVTEIIREALPGTVVLALCAIVFALIFGIVGGIVAAVYRGTFIDGFSLFTAVLGMSAPSFFAAIIVSWLGGYLWSAHTTLPLVPLVLALAGLLLSLSAKKQERTVIRSLSMLLKGLVIGIGLLLLNYFAAGLLGFSFLPGAGAALVLPGTGLNMTGSLYDVDLLEGEYLALHNLILPVITLGIRPLAVVVQLTRNAMLDVLNQDFIRTARAKGLSEYRVVVGHALRNALNPVVTAISGWFASMLAGAVFIEFIFNWKGLGLQVFTSLQNDDYPVVMGAVLVIAVTFVMINILVDVIYGWLDPRIRLS